MKKEQILAEIKRLAQAAGGKAPGRLKFESETGSKESDWKGRYWVRWNDAIREAGLDPNQKNSAYEESYLLEKLAALVKELGHFPVAAELRFKGNTDSNFPSDTPYRRFGNKQQLVARLLKYCQSHPSHRDAVAFCEAAMADAAPEKEGEKVAFEVGYVYLGKSGKHYKIGRSAAPGQRERQLALLLPEKYVELHRIATDDPVGIERYWHKRFEAKWKNGEFYNLDSADVTIFKRRKFM